MIPFKFSPNLQKAKKPTQTSGLFHHQVSASPPVRGVAWVGGSWGVCGAEKWGNGGRNQLTLVLRAEDTETKNCHFWEPIENGILYKFIASIDICICVYTKGRRIIELSGFWEGPFRSSSSTVKEWLFRLAPLLWDASSGS